MQAHARVCEENKKELAIRIIRKKTNAYIWKQFYGERYEFKGSYRKNGETYPDDIRKDDLP